MTYDVLIIGAGFYGATAARKLTDFGKKCLVVDKNPHVAGASHDFAWNNGQIVSSAGAHIFHTHSEEVWQFINQFCEMESFINKPKVKSGNNIYSFPINLMTLNQVWGITTPAEARQKLNEVRIPCANPRNFEEWALDKIGQELYDKFIYGYSKKQWMKEPRDLPSSIIQRLPIRLTYEENYFTTKYQSMPKEGYTKLIETMLDGIDVELGVDFFQMGNWENYAKHLVYTGPVDKFFGYQFGELEYNTLKFEFKMFSGDQQGNAVVNYADLNVPYLRSVEYRHFRRNSLKHYDPNSKDEESSVVSYDYPISYKDHPEPYYPIRDDKNSALYAKYFSLKKDLPNVTFGGRLGEYRYYDLDATIAAAMQKAKKLCLI